MDDFDDEGEPAFDLYGDIEEEKSELPEEMQQTIERMRETLPYDRAVDLFRRRTGEEPTDEELEQFIDELIAETLNLGYDDWEGGPIDME